MGLALIFGSSFLMGFSGAAMPGPFLTVTISRVAKTGFVTGILLMVGHAILEVVMLLALSLGLNRFFELGYVKGTVGILGGAFLVWIAYGMLKGLKTLSLNLDIKEKGSGSSSEMNPVAAGAFVSLANPYWTLWWATIGLGYVVSSMEHGAAGVIAFYGGHITADFLWYGLISYFVSIGVRFLNDKLYRGLMGACGAFLILLGIRFLYWGAQAFMLAVN